jgi:hypothetical protein
VAGTIADLGFPFILDPRQPVTVRGTFRTRRDSGGQGRAPQPATQSARRPTGSGARREAARSDRSHFRLR